MNGLLSELGKHLATRWNQYLLPTGLLYLGILAAAMRLGHPAWPNIAGLPQSLDALAAQPWTKSPGALGVVAIAVLLASMGCGLTVRGLSGGVHRLWCEPWPRSARWLERQLVGWRRRRWAASGSERDKAWRDLMRAMDSHDESAALAYDRFATLNAERNRISLKEPARPTWMADRLRAVDLRVFEGYRIDLDSAWTRLWLLAPKTVRDEVRAARGAYDGATRTAAWALLYLLPALVCWPVALVAIVMVVIGIRRGRAAMDALCELVEATVDLYGRDLAAALGIGGPPAPLSVEIANRPPDGPLSLETGQQITHRLRKGA